jgi:hypothetical protein
MTSYDASIPLALFCLFCFVLIPCCDILISINLFFSRRPLTPTSEAGEWLTNGTARGLMVTVDIRWWMAHRAPRIHTHTHTHTERERERVKKAAPSAAHK